jgi:hypothetical protein
MTEFTLTNGKKAEVTAGTGRDLIEAQRLAAGSHEQLIIALASRLLRVDGKPILYEDLLDWPMADVLVAIDAINGTLGKALSRTTG